MSLTDNEKAALEAIGLNFVYAYNGEADMSAMRINFEDTFTDRFTEGTHEISIVSTDADGRMSSVVFHLRCIICCGRYRTSHIRQTCGLNGNPTRHIGKGCIGRPISVIGRPGHRNGRR